MVRAAFRTLGREFLRNELPLRSAGVSYFLFFALIPIVTTLVSLVVMLPFLKLEAEQVVTHLTNRLVPEAIYDVHAYFVTFTRSAGVVCVVSSLASTYVLAKIIFFFEESVNHFWRLEAKRSLLRLVKKALLLYFVAVVGVVTGIAFPGRGAPHLIAGTLITWALFVGFNRIVPAWPVREQRSVHWYHLLPGSLLCGSIWYVSKWGFTEYLRRFATPGHVAAVLGILPLFLVWLYFSAYMLLLSAFVNSALRSTRSARTVAP